MDRHLHQILARLNQTAADAPDIVSFDVPMLTRVMELVMEDLKSDVELHMVLEKIIAESSKKGAPLTMEDYENVVLRKPSQEEASDKELNELKDLLTSLGAKYVNLSYRMFEMQRGDWNKIRAGLNKEGFFNVSSKTLVKKGFPYNISVTGQGNVYGINIGREPV